ncbi:7-carboxy-7-deazaguanine synthase QueE [Stygiolobus caldivivus]|uniref:7-carboxy-7-deazaguanine synthase QueE n=1 Tax=Stygiolobus caldivivus TaxID=2824673 RepID=UPI001C862C9A|nr:7-carboxy-7-deazaguanine synthase QueE [Stygiolobus caldivivus]
MKYWISEIFQSIQGEGEIIGTPSNFIRLAGCHLRCIWCDTKYSWFKYEGELMTIPEILSRLHKSLPLTTITGGEPLLQDILPLVGAIKNILGQKVLVETSGTITPSKKLMELVDIFSVSPKLTNSGYKFNYDFKNLKWPTYYKFVILNPETDLKEVINFVTDNKIPPERVILQPDGRVPNYKEALKKLADTVMELGLPFRVLPQLHRIIDYR